jgi:hypothetical protein
MRGSTRQQIVFVTKLGLGVNRSAVCGLGIQTYEGLAKHLEPGHRDAEEAISKLIAVLDTQELAAAMNRLENGAAGCGVKPLHIPNGGR